MADTQSVTILNLTRLATVFFKETKILFICNLVNKSCISALPKIFKQKF